MWEECQCIEKNTTLNILFKSINHMLQNLLLICEHAACLVSRTKFMAFGWVFACFLLNRLYMWSNLYLMVSWWTSVASLNVICITWWPAYVMAGVYWCVHFLWCLMLSTGIRSLKVHSSSFLKCCNQNLANYDKNSKYDLKRNIL